MSSHLVLNVCTSIMESCTLSPPRCVSHAEPVNIMREFFDLLSRYTYDGEGKVAWTVFYHDFLAILDDEDGFSDKQASMFLAYTFHESPLWWLCSLLANNMNSLEHFL